MSIQATFQPLAVSGSYQAVKASALIREGATPESLDRRNEWVSIRTTKLRSWFLLVPSPQVTGGIRPPLHPPQP